MEIKIKIPDEMAPFADDLEFFTTLMARKLNINRHKGYGEGKSLSYLYERLCDEQIELCAALQKESQFEALMETVDCANFAFLLGLKLLAINKPDYVKDQMEMRGAKHGDV